MKKNVKYAIVAIITIIGIGANNMLSSDSEDLISDYIIPEMSSDEEVIGLLEAHKEDSVERLYDVASEYFRSEKYKMAYNLYALDSVKLKEIYSETKDEEKLAELSAVKYKMADCYDKVLNYEKATNIINSAVDGYPLSQLETTRMYLYHRRAMINYNRTLVWGYEYSEITEQMFLETLGLEINEEANIEDYEKIKGITKFSLARLYSLSPEVHSPEKAIDMYVDLVKMFPEDTAYKYSLVFSYIEAGDNESAMALWEELKELGISNTNNYTIGVFYSLSIDEAKEAKSYLNKLSIVARNKSNKMKYYQAAANYYSYIDDKEKGREFLGKIVGLVEDEIVTHPFIVLEKALEADYSARRDELIAEHKQMGNNELELVKE